VDLRTVARASLLRIVEGTGRLLSWKRAKRICHTRALLLDHHHVSPPVACFPSPFQRLQQSKVWHKWYVRFLYYVLQSFLSPGSPIQYFPMSLHLPEKFVQLRGRQLLSAERQPWWPAAQGKLNLQDEIVAAISTSLFQPSHLHQRSVIKTSCTHPIRFVLWNSLTTLVLMPYV